MQKTYFICMENFFLKWKYIPVVLLLEHIIMLIPFETVSMSWKR